MTRALRTYVRSVCCAVSLLGTSGLAFAFPQNELGLPHDASVDGHHVDSLIKSTGYMLGFLFVTLVIWLLWTSIVHNEKHPAAYDHGTSKKAVRTTLGVVAVIFFVVDGNLF